MPWELLLTLRVGHHLYPALTKLPESRNPRRVMQRSNVEGNGFPQSPDFRCSLVALLPDDWELHFGASISVNPFMYMHYAT